MVSEMVWCTSFFAGNIWNCMGVLLLGFYRIVIGKKLKYYKNLRDFQKIMKEKGENL